MYDDDQMLMLSGIQHFMFCKRQWALIHIEQQWADNRLTAEGHIMHANVDNPFAREKNRGSITLHAVHLASHELGLYGIADAIELLPAESEDDSITLPKYPGLWTPYPIEYKHGCEKADECDEVQLAAQVMCLEEMHGITIERAAFFYGQTRRRDEIEISPNLRDLVKELSHEMHIIFEKGSLPSAIPSKRCKKCSLINICLPELSEHQSPSTYLKKHLYEEVT